MTGVLTTDFPSQSSSRRVQPDLRNLVGPNRLDQPQRLEVIAGTTNDRRRGSFAIDNLNTNTYDDFYGVRSRARRYWLSLSPENRRDR